GLASVLTGFKDGLAELGYVEGENVTFIYNGAPGEISHLPALAEELVADEVDLIFAIGTPAAQAAQQAAMSSKTSIVFAAVFDPIAAGLVRSLAAPGGNLTGIHWGLAEPRRLQLLLDIVPNAKRIYFPYNPDDPAPTLALARVREAALAHEVEIVTQEARTSDEIEPAVTAIPEDIDAIFLPPDNLFTTHVTSLAETAIARQLPLSVPSPIMTEAGGLVSFGISLSQSGKNAARLADQIILGVSPSELPVETDDFFLTINLKTAAAIHIQIPNEILLQADTLIR
ncbi:MAG: ABC transporter substrate-binding protein, partial [Anaerolineae bacterium]